MSASTHPQHTITGLILAGGAGRRMGGVDKGLLPWGNTTLVARVVGRLRPQVGTLLISCNRNTQYYASLADATIGDSRGDFQGPLAGLEAATPHLTTEFLAIVPCDTPQLPENLVSRLVSALNAQGRAPADISYAHDGIRGQYLCAAMRRECLASLPAYLNAGHRAVRHWFATHHAVQVDFSDQENSFYNVNEPAQPVDSG